MMDKELLAFDLDGTIVDSSVDIAWAANKTLSSFGREPATMEKVKESIGWGVKSLLQGLMPDFPPESLDGARLKFLEYYGGHLTVDSRIYPGVMETVAHFRARGKKMAVVTNKPAGLSERLLKKFGMSGFFDLVVGGDSFPNRKPHPEPLLKVIEKLGATPEKAVFVGDSPTDSETGKNAGVFTIGVSYGFRPLEELRTAGFGMIIDDFPALLELIR